MTLRWGADWNEPRFIVDSLSREARGTAPDGSAWRVLHSSGSGGSNTDLSIDDASGKKLEWWANSNSGYPELLVSRASDKTRFLCYQYYWTGPNKLIFENPSLIRYGIWLVERDPEGYRLRPIVRNPVSLIVREPEYLLLVLERLMNWWS